MNPRSTQRFRGVTAVLALSWGLLAVALSLDALVDPDDVLGPPFLESRLGTVSVVDGLAPHAMGSIEIGDRVVAIDGEPFIEAIPRLADWLSAGVTNRYQVEKPDGRLLEYDLEPIPAADLVPNTRVIFHALLLVVATIYLAIGTIVWRLKPDHSGAWALALFCSAMTYLLSTSIQMDLIQWSSWRMRLNTPFIGAVTFHLFTTYPIEPAWIVRHRRIRTIPYILAALLAGLSLFGAGSWISTGTAENASFLYAVVMFVVSLSVLAVERRRHLEGALRDRADVVFYGALVSFVPVLLVLFAEWLFNMPVPYYIALLWVFLVPLAVGFGIVKRQLFGVRSLAKSSAAYGAATLAITGGFAFLITFADTLVWRLNVSFRWFQVGFLFFAILLFNPLRNRLQALVDRFFDRDHIGYRVAVREISEAMVSMLSLNEIADRILLALTDTMGVESAMVLLVHDEDKVLAPMASRGEWDDEALDIRIPSDHPIWKQLWMRREDLSRIDFDDEADLENRESCRDVFDTLEVEILVPILYGVDLLGVIAVGRKISGERLTADDRVLLRTLANQSSIAIENAKAFDEIAKLNATLEVRVDERTRELRDTQAQLVESEKMKSLGQLVAGVAHELNNPIGFVHANLQLLDEYVIKLIDGQRNETDTMRTQEAIAKLLSRSREGTERVKQIVADLRTFSRIDQAEIQVVDLHEEIDRTLALMEPRFKNVITVERHYGDLPRVRCYPGQLNQVFLNLLMNACDAIDDGGTIEVRTFRTEGGVRLIFKDDGPGIPETVKSRIFDPFFTTKAVGDGTGLGLSLSHGIIERHGGTIRVESETGRGAAFVIDLPLDAMPDE